MRGGLIINPIPARGGAWGDPRVADPRGNFWDEVGIVHPQSRVPKIQELLPVQREGKIKYLLCGRFGDLLGRSGDMQSVTVVGTVPGGALGAPQTLPGCWVLSGIGFHPALEVSPAWR